MPTPIWRVKSIRSWANNRVIQRNICIVHFTFAFKYHSHMAKQNAPVADAVLRRAIGLTRLGEWEGGAEI